MLDSKGEATVLGLLLLYLVGVVFALTFFMSGQGQVLGLDPYQFERTFNLADENLTIEDIGGVIDSGDWDFNATLGLTSIDAGTNRVLFALEPDQHGRYKNTFTVSNPSEKSFDLFVKYYIVLYVTRYGTGYHFTDAGIIPFETGLLGETQYDIIPYSNANDQFIRPEVSTVFYRLEGLPEYGTEGPMHQAVEITTLTVNGEEIHKFATVESWWAYPLTSVYYSGVQVEGTGLSLLRYTTSFDEAIPEDWDTSIWGFIKTLGYITAWTLPREYFTTDMGMWIFALVDVMAIKIPIVVIGYIALRLGRGGG